MTQRQLEIFVTLADTLNFTRTSEYLYLSQTTVTLQIRNLEEELGVKLFERTSRSVRLTAAGKLFHEKVVQILKNMEEAKESAKVIDQGYTGFLEIGFATEANATGIAVLFDEFMCSNPKTRLRIYGGYPSTLMEGLQRGQYDLIMGPSFENVKSMDFQTFVIGQYPLVAVFRKDHPFAKKKSVTCRDFEGERLVLTSSEDIKLDYTGEFFHRLQEKNIHTHVVAETDDIESILIMMESGFGISVIPEYFKGRFHGTSGLKTCPIRENLNGVRYSAMWKKGSRSKELRSFIDQMKAHYSIPAEMNP